MMKLTQYIRGLDALTIAVDELPKELRNRALLQAVKRTVEMSQKVSAQIMWSKDSQPLDKRQKGRPRLKDEIVSKVKQYQRGHVIYAISGPKQMFQGLGGKQLLHARFVEWGHRIVHGGTLKKSSDGKTRGGSHKDRMKRRARYGKGQETAHVPAYEYVKPGFEQAKEYFPDILENSVNEQLRSWQRKEARRIAREARKNG